MRWLRVVWVAGAIVAADVELAWADATDARAAAADAANAAQQMKARDYRHAAESWESAFKHQPDPKFLIFAARARRRAGDFAQAATHYARFLEDAPEKSPQRPAAKRELANVEASVSRIEIKANGASDITLDGRPVERATVMVYAAPGSHVVEAKFGASNVTESVVSASGQVATVVLEPPPSAPSPVVATPAATERSSVRVREKPLKPIVVWVGAGATVVLGALSVVSGLDVISHRETFVNNRTQENLDDGKSKQLRTNILIALTGASAVFTAVAAIWLVDWKGKDGQVKAQLGVSPNALFVNAKF